MRRKWLGLTAALALSFFGRGASAAASREHIVWLMPEFVVGEVPGQGRQHRGLAQPAIDYLISQWPEARHEVVNANVKRSWKMLDEGQPVCYVMTLRTAEREPRAYFSDIFLVPPLQLIVRKDKAAQLPRAASGEVDLHRLLEHHALHGVLMENRSYGPVISEELAHAGRDAGLSYYPPGDYGGRLLQMLARGMADYSIEYDVSLTGQRRNAMPGQIELLSLPVQGANVPLKAGIACPRNEWGQRTVERVNQILGTPAGQVALKRSYELWMAPQTRARYGAGFDAQFGEWMSKVAR